MLFLAQRAIYRCIDVCVSPLGPSKALLVYIYLSFSDFIEWFEVFRDCLKHFLCVGCLEDNIYVVLVDRALDDSYKLTVSLLLPIEDLDLALVVNTLKNKLLFLIII